VRACRRRAVSAAPQNPPRKPVDLCRLRRDDDGRDGVLSEIARRTGCGLLLDVNNVHVSAANHGFDPYRYLASFPFAAVGEIHLAGYGDDSDDAGLPLLVDAHNSPVREAVWALYRDAVRRLGPTPTLVEWDNDLPQWPVLLGEARRVETAMAASARRETERADAV